MFGNFPDECEHELRKVNNNPESLFINNTTDIDIS